MISCGADKSIYFRTAQKVTLLQLYVLFFQFVFFFLNNLTTKELIERVITEFIQELFGVSVSLSPTLSQYKRLHSENYFCEA